MTNIKSLINIKEDGTVDGRIDGYDPYNYIPAASSAAAKPLVIDATLPEIPVTRNVPLNDGLGTVAVERVVINPLTEQLLSGNVYGTFTLNEQAFQSMITPTLINGLQLNGVSANEYLPTVGTIGFTGSYLGKKAAQFKGSYLDTNTKAAGIRLPAFSTTNFPYFLLEGFVYLESQPSSNYDPIIITRSANGTVNNSQDSFRLEYDTSANQIQFHFSPESYKTSAGYANVINVSPSGGVTLNQWHHFAITYLNSGGSASVFTYWNGIRLFTVSGLSGNIRNSTASVCVGSGVSGDRPFKGWLDDIMISAGGITTALRSFQPGETAPVPNSPLSSGDYTVYHLSMNGPMGTSIFPCDNQEKIISSVSYVDRFNGVVGTANTVRVQDSITGLTLFEGVCSGHDVSGASAAYVFGYDSGAAMIVTNVNQLKTLNESKQVRSNLADFTVSYLLGATAMRGICGSPGDFPKLFSRNWGGLTFTFLPTQANVANIRTIYDDIVINGRTGSYTIADFEGNLYSVVTADIKNLYSDVVSYHSSAVVTASAIKNTIAGATTSQNLNKIVGFTSEGYAAKIAPTVNSVGILYISPKARASKKTNTPELKFLKLDVPEALEEFKF